MHYIFKSTFVCSFLFLELTLQQENQIYINLQNLQTWLLLFLSLFDNNFILIGHSKLWVQRRRTRGVLKIEGCRQKGSSYSWAYENSWCFLNDDWLWGHVS